MITAEQAWANSKPMLAQKESERAIREGEELEAILYSIEVASKKGLMFIRVPTLTLWQGKELRRLGYRLSSTLGREYICWEVYKIIEPEPKKSFWQNLLDYFKGNKC